VEFFVLVKVYQPNYLGHGCDLNDNLTKRLRNTSLCTLDKIYFKGISGVQKPQNLVPGSNVGFIVHLYV